MEPTHHQHNPTDPDQLRAWITKWIAASWVWHARFLSGTETSATQTRRPGPRVPRALLEPAFPSLADDAGPTTVTFDIQIDSHGSPGERGPGRSAHRQRPLRLTTPRDPHHRLRHLVPPAESREHRGAGDLRVSARPLHGLSQMSGLDLPEPGRDGRCGRPDWPGGTRFPCPVGLLNDGPQLRRLLPLATPGRRHHCHSPITSATSKRPGDRATQRTVHAQSRPDHEGSGYGSNGCSGRIKTKSQRGSGSTPTSDQWDPPRNQRGKKHENEGTGSDRSSSVYLTPRARGVSPRRPRSCRRTRWSWPVSRHS